MDRLLSPTLPGKRRGGLDWPAAPVAIPVQGRKETAWAQQQGTLRQHRAPLVDPVQVAPRHVRHPDGPRRTVEKLVAVSERETKHSRVMASHHGKVLHSQALT